MGKGKLRVTERGLGQNPKAWDRVRNTIALSFREISESVGWKNRLEGEK